MRCASTRFPVFACAALVLLVTGASQFRAKAQARIEYIDLQRFPAITLHVSLSGPSEGGKPDIRGIGLSENGIPHAVDYFECPEDSIRLSIGILLDRSASMAQLGGKPDPDSTKLREAKSAISSFLGLLGARDQGALFSFATEPYTLRHLFTVEQDFTFDAWRVGAALVPIAAGGGTRMWQAVIDAVRLLDGRAGRRILILLTDGKNQLGESYRSTAIQRAKDAGIPVFTIALGPDADIGVLAGLAEATGGRFHFAPEPRDLQDAFDALGESILTDNCVLQYVSRNPCYDGSRRDIHLEFAGPGYVMEADSFYTVASRIGTVTLQPELPGSVFARDSLAVPIILPEYLSIKEAVSYDMTIRYSYDLMQFMRLETAGSMSDGAEVLVRETEPGELQVSCTSMYPFFPSGSLFTLHFLSLPSDSAARAVVHISDAMLEGRCPVQVLVEGAEVEIRPCEDHFLYGDSLWVILRPDGTDGLLPLMLRGTLPAGAEARVVLRLSSEDLPFDIHGVETAGGMCAGGGVLMQEIEPGLLEFTASATGGDDSLLFSLRIAAREAPRAPLFAAMRMGPVEISTGCRVIAEGDFSGLWGTVIIDGICEPVLRLRRQHAVRNYPNPFVDGTSIQFVLPEDGRTVLRVMDGSGRVVATLLDAPLRRGEYAFRFSGNRLPAGEYYALLEHDGGVEVRRMLLLR
ncbi:MAG: VWA domain-containing protein [Bacteroidetes bacterium]|nr:VWA domain-containing protein [Bacteroidota bacterium]